ncbi:protein nucleotidyltransferase YdiU-like isoform X4 [Centroberyx gerrardi]
MWSFHSILVCFLVAAANFKPVYVLEFCESAERDCHSHDDTASSSQLSQHTVKSRLNTSLANHKHDLDQFKVSSKKLIEAFPVDEVDGNFVRTVKNCIFSKSVPTPLKGPLRLAAVSKDVIEGILDLDVAVTRSDDFLHYASGGRLLPGSVPLAHRYGGHQFGYWAGQLGDGRAHSLGQYTNRKGEIWELQLKGSGKTPYSRSGDGRAVIRSSVREFLCSEALHSLGVPTSRAARKLLNFVIEEHFPSINSADPDKYLVFYTMVVNETAHLIAQWMSVGFAHGVCNTDNFSLLSITIDYGPFGFMESYDTDFVPNTSDDEGRYSIGAQANVGLFNLEKLLAALSPVLTLKQRQGAKTIVKGYFDIYQMRFHQLFKAKLGLLGEEEADGYLIAFLLKLMEDTRSDFTMTFRQLSEASAQQLHNRDFTQMWALDDLSSHKLFSDWLSLYLLRLGRQINDCDEDRQRRMKNVNPRYILRNWMAESAIRKAEINDFSEVELLHRTLSFPYVTQETAEEAGYAARPPLWSKRLKVSCSS